MRLRTDVIGALNLFGIRPGALDEDKLRIGQALADVATIGLLQQRAIQPPRHRHRTAPDRAEQPHPDRAGQGSLAERLHINMADAFMLLRSSARSRNRRLSDLAQAIVDGTEQLAPPTTVGTQSPDHDGSSAPA